MRQKKVNDIQRGPALFKEKLERKIAEATATLAATLLICYFPSVVVLLFGETVPFLRTSSFFRWSESLIQLNSLVNPLLYCFVLNRHFRNAILGRKSEGILLPRLRARQRSPPGRVITTCELTREKVEVLEHVDFS